MKMKTYFEIETNDEIENGITDIALVTYLVCEGFKILRIVRSSKEDRKKSIFVFKKTSELDLATLKFFNREGRVEPLHFSETLKNLKSYAKQS